MTNGHPLPLGEDPGCFWHGPEPIPSGSFRVCFECGHCYRTREDFAAVVVRTHNEAFPRRPIEAAEVDPDTFPFCPLCAHDL